MRFLTGDSYPRLFVALEEQLLVLDYSSGRWIEESKLENSGPQCVAIDPFNESRVYCGTFEKGLFASDDFGKTWRQIGKAAIRGAITSIAVTTNERSDHFGVLYVGTEPSLLYRSENGGESWKASDDMLRLPSSKTWSFPPKPYTHHVRTIVPDSKRSGLIYVAIEAGALIRSFDGGKSWRDRVEGGPYDTHNLVTNPNSAGRLYSAAGDGFFESRDYGENWQNLEKGLKQTYLYSVAVNRSDPDTILVSASLGPWTAYNAENAESHVYRKTKSKDWEECKDSIPSEGTTASFLVADTVSKGRFYAANNRGIFITEDTGCSWQKLDIPWQTSFTTQHVHYLALGQ